MGARPLQVHQTALPAAFYQSLCPPPDTSGFLQQMALGALNGCWFGRPDQSNWGNSGSFAEFILNVYEQPQSSEVLVLVRRAWQATDCPGIRTEGLWMERTALPSATQFENCGFALLRRGAISSACPEHDVVIIRVLARLVQGARHWLEAHPFTGGRPAYPVCSVARSAEFAWLFLTALAGATSARPCSWPEGRPVEVRQAQHVRYRVALGLAEQVQFTRLDEPGRCHLSELLLLMPAFLAAMYQSSHQEGDLCSQELVSELANDYLNVFFGAAAQQTKFHSSGQRDSGLW